MKIKTNINKILQVAVLAMGLGTVVPLANVSATDVGWGPERATFTWEKPASYVTFNSITDNPEVGDERNFVRVKEAGTDDKYRDNVDLEVGKEYEVFVYYHNNASASLNESGKGVAEDVRLTTIFPDKLKSGEAGVVKATISSPDANPKQVYDEAYLHASSTVYLRYVANSAVIHNGGALNGSVLSTDLFNTEQGAYLGHFKDYWGMIPGCNEYAGYVTYRIKVDQPGFEMTKTTSKDLANEYAENITAKPGETIDFKILYKNTGTTDQLSVTVYDKMPEGLKYVEGTTFVKTPTNGSGEFVVDKLFDGGLVLGDFHAGEWAEITYKAVLDEDTTLFPCGTTKIYNNSSVATANGTKYDKVEISVTRDCGGTTTVVESCQNEDGSRKDTPECNKCYNEDGSVKDTYECKCYNEDGSVKDTAECQNQTEALPSELPSTGPTEIVVTVVLMVGLWVAGAYWYGSHRELKKLTKEL